jgi:hypothetical protein
MLHLAGKASTRRRPVNSALGLAIYLSRKMLTSLHGDENLVLSLQYSWSIMEEFDDPI